MLTIETINNLRWSDPNHTHFVCDIKFYEFPNTFISYGVFVHDMSEHVQEIVQGINQGIFEIASDPIYSTQEEWDKVLTPTPVTDEIDSISDQNTTEPLSPST